MYRMKMIFWALCFWISHLIDCIHLGFGALHLSFSAWRTCHGRCRQSCERIIPLLIVLVAVSPARWSVRRWKRTSPSCRRAHQLTWWLRRTRKWSSLLSPPSRKSTPHTGTWLTGRSTTSRYWMYSRSLMEKPRIHREMSKIFVSYLLFVILKLYRWGVCSSRSSKCSDWQSHLDHWPHWWYHQLCSQVPPPVLKYPENEPLRNSILILLWSVFFLSLLLLNYFYLLIRFSLGLSSLSGIIRQRRWDFFLPVFKRHTNLWLFHQFSNGILTYDFFTSFQTTYKPMTFSPVFGRQKKRHTNLWLFSQFSDGKKNDIQTYDFFPSFRTAKKTTYKPLTFFPVFGRQKKRHTNLWLFSQFSDGKKNDIQTYDFFPSFRTAKKRHTNLWLFSQFSDGKKNDIQTYDFFTSFQTTH